VWKRGTRSLELNERRAIERIKKARAAIAKAQGSSSAILTNNSGTAGWRLQVDNDPDPAVLGSS
jgi:hypothetical protein